ncbi:vWA domain-containing protein [Nonomuraea sp. H19]|uniref:vWA domain-containing protein n=1 Tax=Nonomuraea sp. H19 TaxID=3452206 RepID=UPI003F8A4E04
MTSPSTELFTVFPVFLLIDVSASMAGGPIEAINAALPDLQRELQSDPMVGEIAQVAIVTFSDEARVALPLSDLAKVQLPELYVEGGTNFAAAFRESRHAIESGMRSLPKGTPVCRPVVFFMSDGEHQARESWTDALKQLRDPGWKFAPEVVTFGFGTAKREPLQVIATTFAFDCRDADPAIQVREIIKTLIKSIKTTSASLTDPSQAQGLHLDTPTEHFARLPTIPMD